MALNWASISSADNLTHAVVAACMVLIAAHFALTLISRARGADSRSQIPNFVLAGLVCSVGFWCSQIIGMSYLLPGQSVSIEIVTALSAPALAAILFLPAAAMYVTRRDSGFGSAIVAGCLVAGATTFLYFITISALRVSAPVIWKTDTVILSTIILLVASVGAMVSLRSGEISKQVLPAAAILTIAVTSHDLLMSRAIVIGVDTDSTAILPLVTLEAVIAVFAVLMVCSGVALYWVARPDAVETKVEVDALAVASSNSDAPLRQGLTLFDANGRFEIWNDEFLRIYRIPPGLLTAGLSTQDFYSATAAAGVSCQNFELSRRVLRQAVSVGTPASQVLEMDDGRTVRVDVRPMANGGWLATHEDLSETGSSAQASQIMRDPVTNLPNRKNFGLRFADHIVQAAASGRKFSLARIEVDRLKVINETFGELVGDAVLVELASRFRKACPNGIVGRVGGVEFALLTSLDERAEQGQELATRLSNVLQDSLHINGQRVDLCCFVGISVFPKDATDSQGLMDYARVALQCSKDEGRSKIYTFDSSMDRRILDQRMLQRDLLVALANEEFELYFQPQAAPNNSIVSFEVLLRWHHPKRGMIPPGVFIPLAEQFGLIGLIDAWVLRQACIEAAKWTVPLAISVNLSAMDFREEDVSARVAAILNETGLDPRRLEVEVTEGVLIEDFERAASILHRIKELGVSVAMDDFGSGYSSLSYLQAFPFDKIKIDRLFISRLEQHPQSAVIVQAIIALGRSLAMPTIAEGVETEYQRDFLVREGCDELQGYLIGRPLPIASYNDLVYRPGLKRVM